MSAAARRAIAGAAALAALAGAHGIAAPASAGDGADPPSAATPTTRVWNFRVLLDGQTIGRHRYAVTTHGDRREVRSDAAFEVRLLGFVAYRYRHEARERWQRDCLVELDAQTDDDGRTSRIDATRIDAARADAGLRVSGGDAPRLLPGCVLSYAYWNPAMLTQSRLLNAQTGELETLRIERLGHGSVDVGGTATPAVRWRVSGAHAPIELWYSAQGEWLGLDSTVAGGRRLGYRLDTKDSG